MARFICALLLLAAWGQNEPAAAAFSSKSASSRRKTTTRPKTLADAQIQQAIMIKLAKSKLRKDHFTVSVSKGVATIEGSTNVMQHKGVMTRMAKSSGAIAVRNNIRISDAARSAAATSLAKARAPVIRSKATSPPPPIPRAHVLNPAGSQ